MSLAYVVAHGSTAFGVFLNSRKTEGIKTRVAQLEQDLEDLTKLINEIREVEQKAQQFINSRSAIY